MIGSSLSLLRSELYPSCFASASPLRRSWADPRDPLSKPSTWTPETWRSRQKQQTTLQDTELSVTAWKSIYVRFCARLCCEEPCEVWVIGIRSKQLICHCVIMSSCKQCAQLDVLTGQCNS
jgi:hypothetical protein